MWQGGSVRRLAVGGLISRQKGHGRPGSALAHMSTRPDNNNQSKNNNKATHHNKKKKKKKKQQQDTHKLTWDQDMDQDIIAQRQ